MTTKTTKTTKEMALELVTAVVRMAIQAGERVTADEVQRMLAAAEQQAKEQKVRDAAPELLAAAREALDMRGYDRWAQERFESGLVAKKDEYRAIVLRAAIDRAEGRVRPEPFDCGCDSNALEGHDGRCINCGGRIA